MYVTRHCCSRSRERKPSIITSITPCSPLTRMQQQSCFSGVEDEHDNNHWCSAKPCVDIVFDEHHMNVQIEAQCFEVGMPAIHVGSVDCDSLQDDAVGICCTSPMQPDLRLHASCCSVEDDHELNDLSQLRSAVRSSHPLPLSLGGLLPRHSPRDL